VLRELEKLNRFFREVGDKKPSRNITARRKWKQKGRDEVAWLSIGESVQKEVQIWNS